MKARTAIAIALAFLFCTTSPAAIVILDDFDEDTLKENGEANKDAGIGGVGAVFGFNSAIEDFRRFGLGEQGWRYRSDLRQIGFFLDQARKAFDAGKFEQSRALLIQADEELPDHPLIEMAMADTLLNLKDYQGALDWIVRARKDGMDGRLATWYEAMCREGLGEVSEAREQYESLLDVEHPELRQQALVSTMRLSLASGDTFEEVEAVLLDILDREAENELVLEALLSLSMNTGNKEKSVEYAEALIVARPDSATGYLGKIMAGQAAGDQASLQKETVAFIRKFPARYEGYVFMANALVAAEQFDQALKLLESAVGKVENKRQVIHAISRVYSAQEKWRETLVLLITLLREDPANDVYWGDYLKAIDRLLAGSPPEAMPVFKSEDGAAKHQAESRREIQAGNNVKAARHLIRAMAAGEPEVGMFNDLGCMIAPALGADSAVPFFDMALVSAPNYREARNNLKQLKAATASQRRAEMMQGIKDRIAKGEGSARDENELGELMAQDGKVEAARAHFEQAVKLDPTLAVAHLNLGQAMFRSGELKSALKAVELAVAHRGEWLAPLYRHSWLILQQKKERIAEDQFLLVAARELQLQKQNDLYYRGLGFLLEAERYVLTKPIVVAESKIRQCFLFAEEHGFNEMHEKALALKIQLSNRL